MANSTNPRFPSNSMNDFSGRQDPVEGRRMDEMDERGSRFRDELGVNARRYLDEATDWLEENRGRVIAVAGAVAAVGILGLVLYRAMDRRREIEQHREMEHEHVSAA